MLTLVAVATCGGIFGGPQGPSGRAGARGAEQICGEAGGNRRCNPGDGAEHGHERVGQRVGQADTVDPGFRRRDQERHGGARRRPFLAQPKRCWQDAAGAQGQWRAEDRPPEHRLDLSGPDEPGEQPARHQDRKHPGEQEAEEEEDRSVFQDSPGFPKDSEQKVDHHSPVFEAVGGRMVRSQPLCPAAAPCADTAAARPRYFGRYFLFNAQATENCGSTTLAI